MGLLQKLGLGQKKARPVGQNLEKGRDLNRRLLERRRNLLVKGGIFVALVLITLAAFPRAGIYRYTVQVGDIWRQETLRAPFSFAIYKDGATLDEERRRVRHTTPPYFLEVPNVQERIAANRDTVLAQLDLILGAYAASRTHKQQREPVQAAEDSLRYLELRRNARLKIPAEGWQLLARSYTAGLPGMEMPPPGPAAGPSLHVQLMTQAWEMAAELVTRGVLDVPLDSVLTDQIVVRNERERWERIMDKTSLFGLNEVYSFVEERFDELYDDRRMASLGAAFFRSIFVPSFQYERAESLQAWEEKAARISPTRGRVDEGAVIVRQGQEITPEIRRILLSFEREQRERGGQTILWRVALGQFLVTLATYLIFFLYLYLLRRQIFDNNRYVTLVVLLFAGIVGLFAIAVRLPDVAIYAVPVAIVPVLLTVMFDSRVGLFGALTLALIGGQLLDYDFEFAFATIFAATLGVFSVRDIKNRGQFFVSAGLVFLGYVVVLGASAVLYDVPRSRFFGDLLLVAVNSFLLILAYPLLWVFERSFDITTDLSLLELSDTNRPLLKELSLRAPGTFNHSLQVANLAEAAADAIGANALLTRVGALYHDVGKMLKPEYFVENQRPSVNPHNQLKPRMSALIIASHVKEGLEMGRQYGLPQRVLDFIPMHHGTTRIEYFYRKALEQQKESEPVILESEFRYPGPRPNAKEAGILMLADSVEAASRSLSDPTHKRLETLIEMIFKARIEDGQLDDTDLTFRDLNQIKETFLNMLLGIYHVRVKYPGQEEAERNAEAPPRPVGAAEKAEDTRLAASGVVGTPEQSVSARFAREEAMSALRDQEEAAPPEAEPTADTPTESGDAPAPGAPEEGDAAREEEGVDERVG